MHGLSFCILWTEYHLHQEDRHTKHCYHDLFSPLTNICLLSPSFPTEIGKGATYTTSTVSRPQGKQSTLGNTLGLDWNSNIYLEKFVTVILKINLLNNYYWSNLEPLCTVILKMLLRKIHRLVFNQPLLTCRCKVVL